MPFPAQVVRVLIASPSDVADEREALRQLIWRWNDLHAEATGVVLLPVGWETHARPELGDHPQAIIDRQLADRADVLIGLFWTRVGTPVPGAVSGTAHEIESFRASGRPALLYFSSRAIPADVDLEGIEAVRTLQKQAQTWGLIGSFASQQELTERAGEALLRLVRERYGLAVQPPPDATSNAALAPAPRIVLRIEREQRPKGFSKQGQMRYSHHTRLVMTNRGNVTARQVQLTWDVDDPSIEAFPQVIGMSDTVDAVPPEGEISYPVAISWGDRTTYTVVVTWQDDGGEPYETRQSLSF